MRQRRTLVLLLLAGLGRAATAQVTKSAKFGIETYGFGRGGGVASSISHSSVTSLLPVSGSIVSAGFQAEIGRLAPTNPSASGPVLYGVHPPSVSPSGGTAAVLAGLNLGGLSGRTSLQLTVGGVPTSDLIVRSSTQLSFVSPPGTPGPQWVVLSGLADSPPLLGEIYYSPALRASPTVVVGGLCVLRNYGSPGESFTTYGSPVAPVTPLLLPQVGSLLIGPSPLEIVLPTTPYPGIEGAAAISVYPVPNDPALHGQALHFQSLSTLASPPYARLSNASVSFVL